MLHLVENLEVSLGNRINNLDWMSDVTKENALEKLAAIHVKIGYPDKWRSYTDLKIENKAYVLNVLAANKFNFEYMRNKMNKPVDPNDWGMNPQTVNAYYSPTRNEIVFPAGILQPPFFYKDADDAVNYGAIGVVIGHEMTHGFDDQGRQYDKDGNLKDWWTEEDAKKFRERTEVLVKQFDAFIVLDTVHANGRLTLGENIADLGGLNVSYDAFKSTTKDQGNQDIDGFTPDQRFYLAYAHLWAQNVRQKEILRRTKEDPHSLGKFRVNGPLPNLMSFHAAFNIKQGEPMFLPIEKQAKIW
jgi:putative endopeptidase